MPGPDLQQALRALADRQPPVDRTAGRAGVDRHRSRHRRARLVVAACLLLVTVLGLRLLAPDDDATLEVLDPSGMPGMLIPDLTDVPPGSLSARTLDGATALADGEASRVWLWAKPGEPKTPAGPVVLLSVRPAVRGPFIERGRESLRTVTGDPGWTQTWPEAAVSILGSDVPGPELTAVLDALPGAGWDAARLDAPADLVPRIAGDPFTEPLPGLGVPSPPTEPTHQVRLALPEGGTLWVVSGDERLVDIARLGAGTAAAFDVRGAPGWIVRPDPAAVPGLVVVTWVEDGRGYALALADGDGRSRPDTDLLARAEALQAIGATEWQALVDRTVAGEGTTETMIATTAPPP